jgi:Flp pilus assembly protein TadB
LVRIFINTIGIIATYYAIQSIIIIFANYNKEIAFKNVAIEKISKLSIFKKIAYSIIESNISFKIKNTNIISTTSIFIVSILISIIIFIYSYNFLNLFLSSSILAIFTFFIPYLMIRYLSHLRKERILKVFPNYVVNLKNYTDVNNDIIDALRRANSDVLLEKYINKFNISLQKGVKIYDAFESLKRNINIKKINQFLTLLQFCYIYGGNFSELLDKFSKIQMKINIQIEKEKQKTFSSKFVLIILIIINIYILFGFILNNSEYYDILTKTFVGNLILNINILSYIFIFYMYIKLNSMEE